MSGFAKIAYATMSIRAYPSAEKLEAKFVPSKDASQPVELFYLISTTSEAARVKRQLTAAAHTGGAELRFFGRIDQLLIGEGKQPWHYAALIRFSSAKAAIQAARDDSVLIDVDRLAIYPIREQLPPPLLLAVFKLLRVVGKILDTGDANLPVYLPGGQRPEVIPSADQMKTRATDTRECPVYCINFLNYRDRAEYTDGRPTTLSGTDAYMRYGLRAISAVRALGGCPMFGGLAGAALVDGGDSAVSGAWHNIIIVRYPTPRAILKLTDIPWYNAGHVHRDAGLENTALLVASEVDSS